MADSEILLAFKAGRAFRREGSNTVEPSPTKGAIILASGNDDGLLHFMWKNRVTNETEEDLILFPTDASFVKVSGRIYVLKFSSSNQRHFFWMQDASSTRDEEFVGNVNGLLQDSDHALTWGASTSSSGSTPQPQASGSSATPGASHQPTPEQLAQLQALVAQMSRNTGSEAPPEYSLIDILTPANLTPLFASHPTLIPALFPHLPPDLPMPPSAEVLQRIISSPQFRAAVANFDQALRTGLLGGLVRGLGLPEEAGTGIEPFLRAVQEQAESDEDEGDEMQTD